MQEAAQGVCMREMGCHAADLEEDGVGVHMIERYAQKVSNGVNDRAKAARYQEDVCPARLQPCHQLWNAWPRHPRLISKESSPLQIAPQREAALTQSRDVARG